MKVLCAYNINLDALHRVTGAEISDLTARLPLSRSPPKVIASPRDFLDTLRTYIKDGSRGEIQVMDKE
jgi:ADP-dependent phosphofructokinase/glucokinase